MHLWLIEISIAKYPTGLFYFNSLSCTKLQGVVDVICAYENTELKNCHDLVSRYVVLLIMITYANMTNNLSNAIIYISNNANGEH